MWQRFEILSWNHFNPHTPQSLYNTIFGVQAHFRDSYPNPVISRVKCIGCIRKGVLNSHSGSNLDPCYNRNHVITNPVIKRFRCMSGGHPFLQTGLVHFKFYGCLVYFPVVILFQIEIPVSKQCRPWSDAAEYLMWVYCLPTSNFWDARHVWVKCTL